MVEGKNNKQKNRTKYFLPGGKKQIQAVCAFLFLGVLILSCGVNLMHKDRQMSEKEMRMLAQKPEISLSGIASGRFMEQYEEYVSDQFAGRDTWVRIKTFADSVAGRTEEGGVFKGKDHYLMEDVAVADESDLKENLDAMKNFKERYPDAYDAGSECGKCYGGQASGICGDCQSEQTDQPCKGRTWRFL